MRRLAALLPTLLLAVVLLALGRHPSPADLPPLPGPAVPAGVLHGPLPGLLRLVAFGLLAVLADGSVRVWRHDLPLYRRHLAVLLAVAVLGLGAGSGGAAAAGGALGLLGVSLPYLATRRLGGAAWWRGNRVRPEPSRALILVADPHWGQDLTGLAAATGAHPEADWLFLGDLFDVWVGLPGMEGPGQRAFLAWVAERRQAGRWVGLWLGNREFFLDGLRDRFDLMGEGVGGALPREGLAWEHGDLVNAADWRYRLWNLVSRSGPLWLAARLLPSGTLHRLALRLEASMRTTNRTYKLTFPREAFRIAAAETPDSVFLTGHFHSHEVEGRGIALPWAHEGRFMVWREGRVEPLEG
jgi:UDP-2,3-diacylglucosamine pyrophosphatase LpxH